ncbi:MAG: polysaccharide biosynthesis protein [Acidobacteria bacterium]|mgnify:CR=1 FL=1|nr:polysaccharide biosynthesis protein [Acidobacteriota bacterium]|tara:strand:- start:1923 stop:3806 length:1884 start_codon:yes stop_codon:yes gene_type:complete
MRNRYVLLADAVVISCAALGAFVIYFGWLFFQFRPEFLPFLAVALLVKLVVFYWCGLYRRYWRYASISDLLLVALAWGAGAVAMSLLVAVALWVGWIQEFSRATLVIDSLLTLLAVGAIRLSIRVFYDPGVKTQPRWPFSQGEETARKRVLVVGAGDAGMIVVREMQRNPQLRMDAVAFLDDDPEKLGKRIYEVPVLGNTGSLKQVARNQSIEGVIISMPTAPGASVREVVETCHNLGLRSQTMPGVFELLDGKVSLSQLRRVEITDLLRRSQVATSVMSSRYVTNQTVLVTGAGGSIGSELCRQVAFSRPAKLVMLGHGENSLFKAHANLTKTFPDVPIHVAIADIRNQARIEQIFRKFDPKIVFHAAAHKHVHLMEENFQEAISNNVGGTGILVETSLKANTERFVAISTDKAVSPNGFMGVSKRIASHIVRDAGRQSGRLYTVVRFGNVLGSRGSVVPFFKEQIARGGPVTITHPKMKRYFMTIAEAVHLVMEAGGISKGGELFVLNMGEPIRIVDLVEDLIRLSGLRKDQIPIVVTGVRPGEKLEESLWESGAEVQVTANPDILKVTEPEMPVDAFLEAKEALQQAAQKGDRLRVESILCDLVPTFTPSFNDPLSGDDQAAEA